MPNFSDTPDFLGRSTVLYRHGSGRSIFDPGNEAHRESLKHFVKTGTWGMIKFYTEFPYSDVPMTALMKLAEYHLGTAREKVELKASIHALQE